MYTVDSVTIHASVTSETSRRLLRSVVGHYILDNKDDDKDDAYYCTCFCSSSLRCVTDSYSVMWGFI